MTHSRFIIGRWVAAVLAVSGFAAAIYHVVVDNLPKGEMRVIEGYTPWSDEVLALAETLPVQDGGRIKPLSTYAGFTMLQLHGARSMKIADGDGGRIKLKPTEWLLDTLLRPEFGYRLPTFRVDNSAALKAIGVESRGRRDRYSYEELEAGRAKLMELAATYQKVESKKRDPLQNQVVDLASNVRIYESLFAYFSFARNGVLLEGFASDGGNHRTDVSAMMLTSAEVRKHISDSERRGMEMNPRLERALNQVRQAANFARYGLFMFPPRDGGDGRWNSAGELIMDVMLGKLEEPAPAIEDVMRLEAVGRTADDQAQLLGAIESLHQSLQQRAAECGDFDKVEMESNYYRQDFFLKALVLFLLGSLGAMAMWGFGRSRVGRVFYWMTGLLTAAGAAYCVIAIVIRCRIMERPPVGNLYDTIIFIAASSTLIALITEWMTRRRFAMGLGPILGTGLILLARRFELGDASDHMDPLVAVLDSNYWLTTHVITITLGYSAGLLSAFLSVIYVLERGLGLAGDPKDFKRSLTRAVYGMLCFTLLLSLVGTVLGGIWANDSWGRFWGWDPKENGALLIVLWTLAILHARLGGYIREWGIHLASIFTAVVVTFSWWHVNFLGEGLHNYGFTAGKDAIWVFYIAILVMLTFGVVAAVVEKSAARSSRA